MLKYQSEPNRPASDAGASTSSNPHETERNGHERGRQCLDSHAGRTSRTPNIGRPHLSDTKRSEKLIRIISSPPASWSSCRRILKPSKDSSGKSSEISKKRTCGGSQNGSLRRGLAALTIGPRTRATPSSRAAQCSSQLWRRTPSVPDYDAPCPCPSSPRTGRQDCA